MKRFEFNDRLKEDRMQTSDRVLRALTLFLFICAVGAFTSLSRGMWVFYRDTPVARLVDNLRAYVKESPQDPAGHYALGRIHSYAYVTGQNMASGEETKNGRINIPKDIAHPGPGPDIRARAQDDDPALTEKQRLEHLRQGVESIQRALEIGFDEQTFNGESAARLSLAYLYEQGAKDAHNAGFVPGARQFSEIPALELREPARVVNWLINTRPTHNEHVRLRELGPDGALVLLEAARQELPEAQQRARELLTQYWHELAIDQYLMAFRGTLERDLDQEMYARGSAAFRQKVSYEAGQAYLRLVGARGSTLADRDAIAEVNAGLRRLEVRDWDGGFVTPVVLTLDPSRAFGDMIDPDAGVEFDLDGTGKHQRWAWVRPGTGILVWDPDNTGLITSGRQLFGNVTWWVFFDHGYQAMQALDDNRDGSLRADELEGIRVWFDHNSDGVSDEGEVVDLESLGIVALGVRVSSYIGPTPVCDRGVELVDGTVLPSYDWIANGKSPRALEPANTGAETP